MRESHHRICTHINARVAPGPAAVFGGEQVPVPPPGTNIVVVERQGCFWAFVGGAAWVDATGLFLAP